MRRIETSVIIQRPTDQVFAYVIEPSNMPEWAPGYLEGTLTSEAPVGLGSTSTRATEFGGRRSTSEHVVTEFRAGELIATSTKTGPLEIREIFELEPADGGTRVTITEEVTAPFLLKPAEWIFALTAGRNIGTYGTALKKKLEESA